MSTPAKIPVERATGRILHAYHSKRHDVAYDLAAIQVAGLSLDYFDGNMEALKNYAYRAFAAFGVIDYLTHYTPRKQEPEAVIVQIGFTEIIQACRARNLHDEPYQVDYNGKIYYNTWTVYSRQISAGSWEFRFPHFQKAGRDESRFVWARQRRNTVAINTWATPLALPENLLWFANVPKPGGLQIPDSITPQLALQSLPTPAQTPRTEPSTGTYASATARNPSRPTANPLPPHLRPLPLTPATPTKLNPVSVPFSPSDSSSSVNISFDPPWQTRAPITSSCITETSIPANQSPVPPTFPPASPSLHPASPTLPPASPALPPTPPRLLKSQHLSHHRIWTDRHFILPSPYGYSDVVPKVVEDYTDYALWHIPTPLDNLLRVTPNRSTLNYLSELKDEEGTCFITWTGPQSDRPTGIRRIITQIPHTILQILDIPPAQYNELQTDFNGRNVQDALDRRKDEAAMRSRGGKKSKDQRGFYWGIGYSPWPPGMNADNWNVSQSVIPFEPEPPKEHYEDYVFEDDEECPELAEESAVKEAEMEEEDWDEQALGD